ncbi:MAG: ligase-associated DNA damage response endonuclease PdeM [Tepidimonas sp.]|uniref:ligase-associated DNA damage response endonuclease PdeM n=1 Tax=Tepidimonas sp. TaxID=2002775 RepID=UPI00259D44BD|nr:ligase-associated DNA damage response endonuclease PdeM [Tepidimonas sp.]MDM7456041.1 ligase-associated DNA damage response endonuclease PdeM [Tepidimonas sp.]
MRGAFSAPAPVVLQVPRHGPEAALWLLPQRAVWWPSGATLFVADVHLGKAAAFRSAGLAVPSGTTGDNLQRLGALVQRYGARRLVVLGDLLHARAARTPAVLQALRHWRNRHPDLAWVLVRGNHDDHAGDPPSDLGVTVVDEPWSLGPWHCRHAPLAGDEAAPPGPILCGHVHPVCVLRGAARERLRLPCFVLTPSALWLPAFGAFTGGYTVRAAATWLRCAIADDAVWPVDGSPPAPWQISTGQ